MCDSNEEVKLDLEIPLSAKTKVTAQYKLLNNFRMEADIANIENTKYNLGVDCILDEQVKVRTELDFLEKSVMFSTLLKNNAVKAGLELFIRNNTAEFTPGCSIAYNGSDFYAKLHNLKDLEFGIKYMYNTKCNIYANVNTPLETSRRGYSNVIIGIETKSFRENLKVMISMKREFNLLYLLRVNYSTTLKLKTSIFEANNNLHGAAAIGVEISI